MMRLQCREYQMLIESHQIVKEARHRETNLASLASSRGQPVKYCDIYKKGLHLNILSVSSKTLNSKLKNIK